jgi:hypothetical protein
MMRTTTLWILMTTAATAPLGTNCRQGFEESNLLGAAKASRSASTTEVQR